ncbi:hypothetical protein BH09PLA1_BH09PLA1_15470 [soil metagenome]
MLPPNALHARARYRRNPVWNIKRTRRKIGAPRCARAIQASHATVRWLIDHGADVNARVVIWQHPTSQLHLAVADGNVAIVKLLMDAGADLSVQDAKYNATPQQWAEHFGRAEISTLFAR